MHPVYEPKKLVYSQLGLGAYVTHAITPCYSSKITVGSTDYLSFPTESQLYICYDKGREVYLGFNVPVTYMCAINQMTIDKLLKYRLTHELHDKYTLNDFRFGKVKMTFTKIDFYDGRTR